MNFEEALSAMREDKKVKLSINHKDIVLHIDFNDNLIMTPINDGVLIWPLHLLDNNWEIVE